MLIGDLKDREIHELLLRAGGQLRSHGEVSVSQRPSLVNGTLNHPKKHDGYWVDKEREILLVIATVTAAMAYEFGLNPSGGLWHNDNVETHTADQSIMATKSRDSYLRFWIANTVVSFIASLGITFLLVSGMDTPEDKNGHVDANGCNVGNNDVYGIVVFPAHTCRFIIWSIIGIKKLCKCNGNANEIQGDQG